MCSNYKNDKQKQLCNKKSIVQRHDEQDFINHQCITFESRKRFTLFPMCVRFPVDSLDLRPCRPSASSPEGVFVCVKWTRFT